MTNINTSNSHFTSSNTTSLETNFHSGAMIRASGDCDFWQIPVPKLRILIMAVGTRGDMQPFVQLGLRLQRDGHRVRLATHASFRSYIIDKGLEFYPLAGDPVKLSEFMVKTHGFIIPTTAELMREVPAHHSMIVDIMYSCWSACVEADPEDPLQRPFIPDAIISNPVTYAHIHCAEALGVPLHLMFPQPWIPTKAFPHPLSCLSYQQGWCSENYISYQVIDRMLWLSFESNINAFRKGVLGLEPIRVGEGGWNMLNLNKVPFVKMWSPSLVPKPKDWPDYVDVVGTFFDEKEIKKKAPAGIEPEISNSQTEVEVPEYTPSVELASFLKSDVPVVFIGFGSMVIQDIEGLISLFLESAALAGVRVLMQTGWSTISAERFLELAQQAEAKTRLVRQTEFINRSQVESVIFPSDDSNTKNSTKTVNNTNNNTISLQTDSSDDAEFRRQLGLAEEEEEETQPAPAHSTSLPSAPSNMLTGWFYTALTTFVAVKKSEPTPTPATTTTTSTGRDPFTSPELPSAPSVPNKTQRDTSSDSMSEWERGEGGENASKPSTKWSAQSDAFFMGPCPHSWLFKQVDAVVHHGGAGTTAAGLRYGCPTWICPFFGDQFFWGELVHRGGLGPRPVPVDSLTLDIVAESLAVLRSDALRQNAKEISAVLEVEDGVEGAVEAFYRHLPIENMICDVSMFSGESRLAQIFCKDCGFKMCAEVSDVIHSPHGTKHAHQLVPCSYVNWVTPKPGSAAEGIVQGLGGLVHELAEGVSDVLYDPVRGIYSEGLRGGATGLVTGVHSLLTKPLKGTNLLVNRVSAGIRTSLGYADVDSPIRSVADDILSGDLDGDSEDETRSHLSLNSDSLNYTSSSRTQRTSSDLSLEGGAFLLPPPVDHHNSTHNNAHSNHNTSSADIPISNGPNNANTNPQNDTANTNSNTLTSPSTSLAAEEILRDFIKKNGRKSITAANSTIASVGGGGGGGGGDRTQSIFLSYKQAVSAQNMFKVLGAKNARFMSLDVFSALMFRALLRQFATTSNQDDTTTSNNDINNIIANSAPPESQLSEETVENLVKLLARNKRYLDLVDFVLVYQEIIQGGLIWKHLPERTVSCK
eukprot:gene23338-29550_t